MWAIPPWFWIGESIGMSSENSCGGGIIVLQKLLTQEAQLCSHSSGRLYVLPC